MGDKLASNFSEGTMSVANARVVVAKWLREDLQKSEDFVLEILGLLDNDILLAAPRPKGVRLPAKLKAVNWRYLWRRVVAHCLGWTLRRSEGDADSFPTAVNSAMRRLWADPPTNEKDDGAASQTV